MHRRPHIGGEADHSVSESGGYDGGSDLFVTSADEVGEAMFPVAFVCVCVFVGSFVLTITQKLF